MEALYQRGITSEALLMSSSLIRIRSISMNTTIAKNEVISYQNSFDRVELRIEYNWLSEMSSILVYSDKFFELSSSCTQ